MLNLSLAALLVAAIPITSNTLPRITLSTATCLNLAIPLESSGSVDKKRIASLAHEGSSPVTGSTKKLSMAVAELPSVASNKTLSNIEAFTIS